MQKVTRYAIDNLVAIATVLLFATATASTPGF
jgi:hypothetical protein